MRLARAELYHYTFRAERARLSPLKGSLELDQVLLDCPISPVQAGFAAKSG